MKNVRSVCPKCGDDCFIPGRGCPNCKLIAQLILARLTGHRLVIRRGEGSLDAWRTRIYRLIRQRGGGEP
jgi:hypothetical protein